MVDTQYLDKLIKDSGLKKGYLASQLGVSRPYFAMKCKGERDFKSEEIKVLCATLNIDSPVEMEKIFFSK